MKIKIINEIINVDLSKVTLNDVCDIIAQISVDAGVGNNAPTVLYSGTLCGYRTNSIAKSLDDVRIIDNTDLGKFLSASDFNELIENAIKNDIINGTFDVSFVEKGIRYEDDLIRLNEYIDQKSLSSVELEKAVKIASEGFQYEPTKGAWAIASEQFIKATPSGSEIICLTAEADLTRIWAQVEIPTALKHLPDKQVFGGYTIAELKSVYNSNGIESVQNLLKNKAIDITQNVKVQNYISDAEISKLFPDVDFEKLSELEKLQIRQLELEYRRANGIFDIDKFFITNIVKLLYK